MTGKLLQRSVLALVVVLICVYGVIGVPSSWSELEQNVTGRINLGLDLKGGTHLILQVQVHEAIRAEADQVIGHLREDLSSQNIPFDSIERNDPRDVESADLIAITITGIPPERSG